MIVQISAADLKDLTADYDAQTGGFTLHIKFPLGKTGVTEPGTGLDVTVDVQLQPDVISWAQQAMAAAGGGS